MLMCLFFFFKIEYGPPTKKKNKQTIADMIFYV